MRIVLVGGSIAGLSMAWALKRQGLEAIVYERSRGHLAHRGAGVMLAPAAASRLNLESRMVQQRFLLDQNLKVVWERPVLKRAVLWGDVYQQLRSLSEGVNLRDGRQVEKVSVDPVRLLVDGRWEDADVLIGADGLGSLVREVVDPEFEAEYLGYVAVRGVVARERLPKSLPTIFNRLFSDAMAQILLSGEHVTVYGLPSEPPVLNWMWYRNTPVEELENLLTDRTGRPHRWSIPPNSLSREVESALRKQAAQNLPPGLRDLVAATDDLFLQPVYCGSAARSYRGRVILIGDAAHLAVPHAGAGVSLALRDAEALAEVLASGKDLAEWARVRREDADSHLDMAIRTGRYLQTPGRDWSGWTESDFETWWTREILAGEHPYFERGP